MSSDHQYTIANTLDCKRLNLKDRQLYDLELLMVGGFAPLTGFLAEADYHRVVSEMRLTDNALWPIPIVLDIPDSADFAVGEEIVLCDPFGNPLAVMAVSSRYQPDKTVEAAAVYGTTDTTHPGVRYLMQQMHDTYIGGPIYPLQAVAHHDFADLRYTPATLKAALAERGWKTAIGFQTRNPMHRVHFELIKRAHEEIGAPVVIHPVVGMTREGDIDYITRIRTYQIVCDLYGADFTMLALLPLAMRMAGPREVLWHMIVRKNYGLTHFIVGRDHAGPGSNAAGEPFYEPLAAQALALEYQAEIGITVVPSAELAYAPDAAGYVSVPHTAATEYISGTEFRRRLTAGEAIPEWFSFPESIAALETGVSKQKQRGVTLFFTGLSGSGKSTIAQIVTGALLEAQQREVTVLDGDVIRNHLTSELSFSKAHRDLNVARVGYVASEIAKHGGVAVCALIAPYTEARAQARELVERYGTFIEIFVDTPLAVCEERDIKGLYQKARRRLIKNFTGIDDPYEAPTAAELVLDGANNTPEACAEMVLRYLTDRGFYHPKDFC